MLSQSQYDHLTSIDSSIKKNIKKFNDCSALVELYHATIGEEFYLPMIEKYKEYFSSFEDCLNDNDNGNTYNQLFLANDSDEPISLPVLPLSRHFEYFTTLLTDRWDKQKIMNVDISHKSLLAMRDFFDKYHLLSDIEEAFSFFIANTTAYLKIILPVGYNYSQVMCELSEILDDSYLSDDLWSYIHSVDYDEHISPSIAYQENFVCGKRLDFTAELLYDDGNGDGDDEEASLFIMIDHCLTVGRELPQLWVDRALSIYDHMIADDVQYLIKECNIHYNEEYVRVLRKAIIASSTWSAEKTRLYYLCHNSKIMRSVVESIVYHRTDKHSKDEVIGILQGLELEKKSDLHELLDFLNKMVGTRDEKLVKHIKILVREAIDRKERVKNLMKCM